MLYVASVYWNRNIYMFTGHYSDHRSVTIVNLAIRTTRINLKYGINNFSRKGGQGLK